MDKLPPELVEKILSDSAIRIRDVLNVAITCKYLLNVIQHSNILWKTKYSQLWPKVNLIHCKYYNELKYIFQLKKRANGMLKTMPPKFYKKYELSELDLQEWTDLMKENEYVYHYLVGYLLEIVNSCVAINSIDVVPLDTIGNKTFQYYSSKVLRHIRQLYLSNSWQKYISLPSDKQILETGAALVAQWCQPNVVVDCDDISRSLDKIAMQVKQALRISNAQHPLFQVPEKVQDLWRNENIKENQFDIDDSNQLIHVLRQVLFQGLGFVGNNEQYFMPQNSLINEVLCMKHGNKEILSILFEAVARRVGIRCDHLSLNGHFLLRFVRCNSPYDDKFIDVFHDQLFIRSNCNKGMLPVASAVQVVERLANTLEVSARQLTHPNGRITRLRSSLELLKLVNPHDISALVSLARLYMLQNIDTKPLEEFILAQEFQVPEQAQRLVHLLRDYEAHHVRNDTSGQVQSAQRISNLRYAVGMVMSHFHLNYKCVIYEWDPVCLAPMEWQQSNHVDKLEYKNEQPFYNVLVEDGSYRYVAQENLRLTRDTGFLYLNDEVGRHFSHFYETHYVPNAEKENEYPEDNPIRHMFHNQLLLMN